MSRTDDILDAVVLAGSRISGPLAVQAGSPIKALMPITGGPIIDHILAALRDAPEVDRVCVVGPREVRDASKSIDIWTRSQGAPVEDLHAGIESLGSTTRRILVCSCDMPFVSCKAIRSFVHHAPIDAELCVPIVRESDFEKTFPHSIRKYFALSRTNVTLADILIVDTRSVTGNLNRLRTFFDRRKSPLRLAMALGAGCAYRLATGQLTIRELEERASRATQCRCRAVTDCSPVLAYGIDNVLDYQDARKRTRRPAARSERSAGPAMNAGPKLTSP